MQHHILDCRQRQGRMAFEPHRPVPEEAISMSVIAGQVVLARRVPEPESVMPGRAGARDASICVVSPPRGQDGTPEGRQHPDASAGRRPWPTLLCPPGSSRPLTTARYGPLRPVGRDRSGDPSSQLNAAGGPGKWGGGPMWKVADRRTSLLSARLARSSPVVHRPPGRDGQRAPGLRGSLSARAVRPRQQLGGNAGRPSSAGGGGAGPAPAAVRFRQPGKPG